MFEFIGFIGLLLLGGMMVAQGLGMYGVLLGFSGRHSWQALAFAGLGVVVLYFTIVNAPFSVTLN